MHHVFSCENERTGCVETLISPGLPYVYIYG